MSADGAEGLVGIYKIGIKLGLTEAIRCTSFVVGDAIMRFAISSMAAKVTGGLLGNPARMTTGRELLMEKLPQILNRCANSLLVEHAQNPIHHPYEYDPAGELTRTIENLRGEIKYEYEANGQLRSRDTGKLVDGEEFRYDAAANRLNFNTSQFEKVKDKRIKQWRDQEYAYDAWGNLIEKRVGLGKLQTFTYDCENRLVRAETMVNSQVHSVGTYRYDSLGRRVGKTSEIEGQTEHKQFILQGLQMLHEETPWQSSLYI